MARPAASRGTPASYTLHPERRLSRSAVIGAILAPLPLLVMPAYLVPVSTRTVVVQESVSATPDRAAAAAAVTQPEPIEEDAAPADAGAFSPAPRMLIAMLVTLALGLAAPFLTTILGLVAIGRIRGSQGRLYGLPLAVADALLYPLLALNLLIGVFWYHALNDGVGAVNMRAVVILTVVTGVLMDAWLVRVCWRGATSQGAESRLAYDS